jgi:hypothetical protein
MKKNDEFILPLPKRSRNTGVDIEPNSSAMIKASRGFR